MRVWPVGLLAIGCADVFGLTVPGVPCWDSSQVGRDEDGDGVSDGCDNCPGDPDTTQSDEDGDGVGDVCDPHLGDPRDHLIWFDGFNATPPDPMWTLRGDGQWTFEPGVVHQTDAAALTAGLYLAMPLTNATIGVSAEISFDTTGAPAPRVGAGAELFEFDGELRGVSCAVEPRSGSTVLRVADPPNTANAGEANFPPGAITRLRVSATGECAASADGGAVVRVELTNAPVTINSSADVGIFAVGARATFHSVTVIVSDE